jgi:hypothetical protein
MVLTTGEPKTPGAVVVAAAKVSLWRTVTHLILGDPSSSSLPDTSQRVELKLDSKWKTNSYVVSLPLPPTSSDSSANQVLEMQWKGTDKVKGFTKKMDRGMHHKLVEKNSNMLLARYVHNPWSMDVAGSVEIFTDIPGISSEKWDLFVLVNALAIAEKNFKMVNMAVGHMDDDPSGMVEAIVGGTAAVEAATGQVQSAVQGVRQ